MNSMVYGVETWDISDRNMGELEQAHAGMARIIQCLPLNVATDGVMITIGWSRVRTIIDKKRSMFLARTIDAKVDTFPKRLALQQLCLVKDNNTSDSSQIVSPIKMMVESCTRLGLLHQLYSAVDNGGILDMSLWKKQVNAAARNIETSSNQVRAALHPSLEYVLPLVPDTRISQWWVYADRHPNLRPMCRLMVRLSLGYVPGVAYDDNKRCWMCDSLTERDTAYHFLTRCQNERLVPLRQTVIRIIAQSLAVEYVPYDMLMYVCVSGNLEDDVIPQFLCTIYKMHRVRVAALNERKQ